MDVTPWVAVPTAVGVVAAARHAGARERGDAGRTTRTLYRAVVVVILSAFRVRTEDIERRLRAITDDSGP